MTRRLEFRDRLLLQARGRLNRGDGDCEKDIVYEAATGEVVDWTGQALEHGSDADG